MNVSRPARCLFIGPSIPKIRPQIRCQNFHSSPNVCARRRPKHASISAEKMGLAAQRKSATELFPKYTPEEKEYLQSVYTPGQMRAIEAGEEAISPEDLKNRGVIRTDLGAIDYLDDFSKTRPVLDRLPLYDGPKDPNPRIMDIGEAMEEYKRTSDRIKKDHIPPVLGADQDPSDPEYQTEQFPNRAEQMRIMDEASFLMGSDGKAIPWYKNTVLTAPRLPKEFLDEAAIRNESDEDRKKRQAKKERQKQKDKEAEEVDSRDPDGQYNKLIKQSGLDLDTILGYKTKLLVQHRVVNQTRLGKIASVYNLAIAGDGNGRLGVGEAKGQEGEDTRANAIISAIRSMRPIPRYENRTIYGDVEGKMSAAVVKLMARPPGFGLRCQHLIFEMARAAGIQDLSARVPRSRNKMNTVKAAYQALMSQRIPDEVARARGKKLVDVRKVYYGGKV